MYPPLKKMQIFVIAGIFLFVGIFGFVLSFLFPNCKMFSIDFFTYGMMGMLGFCIYGLAFLIRNFIMKEKWKW